MGCEAERVGGAVGQGAGWCIATHLVPESVGPKGLLPSMRVRPAAFVFIIFYSLSLSLFLPSFLPPLSFSL